ncbi:MAG: flagellar export chaperone FliS [Planctomycetales bacterium]|nr:flagellar export chaperone FliS [Planctomycetales bacterium]
MNSSRQKDYLESKVNTASSAQLHLMLIEGALRFLTQADKALLREEEVAANAALVRVLEIVEELMVGVRHSSDEINTKLAALYQFVFTQVSMIYVNGDRQLLREASRILEFQRDTWRQACDKLGNAEKKPAAPAPHLGAAPIDSGVSFEV